jgi:hypothetical protein
MDVIQSYDTSFSQFSDRLQPPLDMLDDFMLTFELFTLAITV